MHGTGRQSSRARLSSLRPDGLHLLPELVPSPTDDLHLVVLMKDVRRTLAR